MRNKYSCKSEFVWNVHIQVMLKVISISVLNMHELLNSQSDSQMYTSPDQMNWQFVQILMGSKFQSKRWCKVNDFFVFYLIHGFIVDVKCRMDGSHRKPYMCLSFDFLIQYSANGTCLTSVNMLEYVTSLRRLWKNYIFPEIPWLDLRGMINFPGMVTHVTQFTH